MLDDGAVDEQGVEVVGRVRGAEPAPQHEVGTGRHGGLEIDLHHPEPAHDVEKVGGTLRVEHLGPHRDAAGLSPSEPVHHEPTPGQTTDGGDTGRRGGQSDSPAKTNLR